jgi:hypothetical protein
MSTAALRPHEAGITSGQTARNAVLLVAATCLCIRKGTQTERRYFQTVIRINFPYSCYKNTTTPIKLEESIGTLRIEIKGICMDKQRDVFTAETLILTFWNSTVLSWHAYTLACD